MSPASALKSIRNQIDQLLTELGSEPKEIAFPITISAPKLKEGDPACPVIGWVDPMGKFEERSFSFNPEPGWTTVIRQSDALAAVAQRDAKREAELIADRERLREALNRIASWPEGETVSGSFDEPGSAQIARDALAATPAQSLAAIENRVLEEAAQACDSLYDGTESSDYGHVLRIKDITDECSTELRRLAAERK